MWRDTRKKSKKGDLIRVGGIVGKDKKKSVIEVVKGEGKKTKLDVDQFTKGSLLDISDIKDLLCFTELKQKWMKKQKKRKTRSRPPSDVTSSSDTDSSSEESDIRRGVR